MHTSQCSSCDAGCQEKVLCSSCDAGCQEKVQEPEMISHEKPASQDVSSRTLPSLRALRTVDTDTSGSIHFASDEGCMSQATASVADHLDNMRQEVAKRESRSRERWKLVDGPWSSCAIGCLPCALNPAGHPSCTVFPR
jgi:hypothetical protein